MRLIYLEKIKQIHQMIPIDKKEEEEVGLNIQLVLKANL